MLGFLPSLALANITPDSGPPQAPILRIDAGGATGAVARVAVDAAGTLMASAGYDKVVRLYSLPDDVLRATLRPPIGEAEEGELYALAISPDGKTVFAAGATGGSWDGRFCIYLFDVAGQKLLARLPGLESPVNDLAVSADGTRLAAGLAKGGVLVWDAHSGRQVFSDADFSGPVRNVRFDRADRLFVTSADGFLRAYGADGRLVGKVAPQAGQKPWGLAVSPDGGFVAVTYEGVSAVDVISARTLKGFFAPDVSGLSGGLLAVDWVVAGGGVSLLAGGYARSGGKNVIREWGDFGFDAPRDVAAAGDTIRDIRAVPGGGAVYATEDPGWGRIGGDGAVALAPAPAVADLRFCRDGGLGVSADGMRVEFSAGGKVFGFDAAARRFGPMAAMDKSVAVARTDGLDVRDWKDTDAPSVGGMRLTLETEEYSRSLAILPGGQKFLLGTDTHLRLFDAGGKLLGSAPVDAAAWAVTVSADGKIAVAALLDGTLRWFGIGDDGRLTPRATLFAAADATRWVLFTPDGFFDEADLGGQNLVGFHVNLGENQQPQWVSFGQGFRLFYAPDVVRAALGGDFGPAQKAEASIGDLHDRLVHEPEVAVQGACVAAGGDCRSIAVGAADVLLPDDASAVTLRISATDRGLGVGAEDVFVNGRNVGREAAPALVNGTGTGQVTVPLDPGPDEVVVRQYDGGNAVYAESAPLTITRTDAGSAAAPAAGTLYVLAVGIDHFAADDASLTLKFAVSDATSFADLVGKAAAPDYAHVDVNLLTDGQATRAGILSALSAVAAKAQPGDTFLFYVASHGGVNAADGQFLIVPEDIRDLSSWGAIEAGSVTEGALIKALAAIRARDSLLFIDTCYAGAVSAANLANVGQESGRYIVSASSSAQEALDSYDGRDGVLIYALRQAIGGDAPHDSHGVIGALSLGEYLSARVGVLARQKGHDQDAAFTAAQSQLNSFPVASVVGE